MARYKIYDTFNSMKANALARHLQIESGEENRRSRVSQSDVPAYSLEQALRVPNAIRENFAFHPTRPLDLAAGLSMSPASSGFRMLCGASIAYGLTEGGYNAPVISVTPLARRILEPQDEGEDDLAKREAALRPRILREFLGKYDGARFPREDIAMNVLAQMGVPRDATERTLELILSTARVVGLLKDIKGNSYVTLAGSAKDLASATTAVPSDFIPDTAYDNRAMQSEQTGASFTPRSTSADNRRVFLTHGKNRSFLDPLKDLLSFGEMEPVVSVERESVSQPVPDKVMAEMRSCGAAIIHVDAEQRVVAQDGDTQITLNSNVLIEIGAAMALYGRRFVLLVREGVTLPSNLQGLYEVRYAGDKLDGESTIKLLKAIRDIKNHPLPSAGNPEA